METYTKIKEGEYEISEMRENKYTISIESIDANIVVLDKRLEYLKSEIPKIENQKTEQIKLKATLLKVK